MYRVLRWSTLYGVMVTWTHYLLAQQSLKTQDSDALVASSPATFTILPIIWYHLTSPQLTLLYRTQHTSGATSSSAAVPPTPGPRRNPNRRRRPGPGPRAPCRSRSWLLWSCIAVGSLLQAWPLRCRGSRRRRRGLRFDLGFGPCCGGRCCY